MPATVDSNELTEELSPVESGLTKSREGEGRYRCGYPDSRKQGHCAGTELCAHNSGTSIRIPRPETRALREGIIRYVRIRNWSVHEGRLALHAVQLCRPHLGRRLISAFSGQWKSLASAHVLFIQTIHSNISGVTDLCRTVD